MSPQSINTDEDYDFSLTASTTTMHAPTEMPSPQITGNRFARRSTARSVGSTDTDDILGLNHSAPRTPRPTTRNAGSTKTDCIVDAILNAGATQRRSGNRFAPRSTSSIEVSYHPSTIKTNKPATYPKEDSVTSSTVSAGASRALKADFYVSTASEREDSVALPRAPRNLATKKPMSTAPLSEYSVLLATSASQLSILDEKVRRLEAENAFLADRNKALEDQLAQTCLTKTTIASPPISPPASVYGMEDLTEMSASEAPFSAAYPSAFCRARSSSTSSQKSARLGSSTADQMSGSKPSTVPSSFSAPRRASPASSRRSSQSSTHHSGFSAAHHMQVSNDDPTVRPSQPPTAALETVMHSLEQELAASTIKLKAQEHLYQNCLATPRSSQTKRRAMYSEAERLRMEVETKAARIYALEDVRIAHAL